MPMSTLNRLARWIFGPPLVLRDEEFLRDQMRAQRSAWLRDIHEPDAIEQARQERRERQRLNALTGERKVQ